MRYVLALLVLFFSVSASAVAMSAPPNWFPLIPMSAQEPGLLVDTANIRKQGRLIQINVRSEFLRSITTTYQDADGKQYDLARPVKFVIEHATYDCPFERFFVTQEDFFDVNNKLIHSNITAEDDPEPVKETTTSGFVFQFVCGKPPVPKPEI